MAERRCHWLSRNRSSRRPEALLFFDTEANIEHPTEREQQHLFRLGVGCYCTYNHKHGLVEQEWRNFSRPADLWLWCVQILDNHQELVITSHNIDYDSRLAEAFRNLPLAGFTPHSAVIAKTCTFFDWRLDKKKLTLLDNLNIFPMSLADLGESVGLEKGHINFDTSNDEELLTYCHRDVEILVKAWKRWFEFLDKHKFGNFAITIARQAFNGYRHTWMPCKIGIHNNARAIGLERDAYRGARCEVFKVGKLPKQTYYKIDVNGLYAAMMKFYPYPRRLVKVIQNVRPDYLNHLLHEYMAIAQVVIETDEPKYPLRYRHRNVYPTGSFHTTLTTPELEQALIADEIRGVGYVALYEGADLFSSYIDSITELRQHYKSSGDFARSQMCKLLRNSLQGKFGQKGYKQNVAGDAPLDDVKIKRYTDAETGRECTDLTFAGKTLRQYKEGEAYDSFPAIPAHVNAYGRVYMWSLMQMAGREHVFYIDTDGMIVDQTGLDNLQGMIDQKKLGYLKIEGVATNIEILAPKDYAINGKRKTKGVKHDAQQLDDNTFEQWHFTTLKYAFISQHLEGVTLRKVRKELRPSVVCGGKTIDGRVEPVHVTVTPEELYSLAACENTSNQWVWEFDHEWFTNLERAHSARWSLTYRVDWSSPDAAPHPRIGLSHELF